jgi:nitric oxide dioxygenase
MTKTLSPQNVAIVKSTAPVLVQHGLAITQRMYERLFENKDIEAMFDRAAQQSGEQPKRLAAAIVAFAQNVDNLPALAGAVEKMARRHVETNVKPEHYPIVAGALIAAIKDVLGDVATDEVIDAWTAAYGVLAEVLIGREAELYTLEPAE